MIADQIIGGAMILGGLVVGLVAFLDLTFWGDR